MTTPRSAQNTEAVMSTQSSRAPTLSDAESFSTARQALDASPTVPGTVRVHVKDGLVTLTGVVQDPSHRADAERAVRPTIGGRRLLNHIVVTRAPLAEGFAAPEGRRP
jgi:osmotically-inducible protein OsmY